MALIFRSPRYSSPFDSVFRDMERLERGLLPLWFQPPAEMEQEIASSAPEVIDDDKNFGVKMDVSQFKPEELKVNLDGRVLTVEGTHESKDEHSCTQRSFTRKWLLPEGVDLSAIRSQLDDKGHLQIEAPKKSAPSARNIAIEKK